MANELEIDEKALEKLVKTSDETKALISYHTTASVDAANAASASFRTAIFHRPNGEVVGDTQPEYGGDVQDVRGCWVGLVHPKNYAAMKDNHERNTMLKSLR